MNHISIGRGTWAGGMAAACLILMLALLSGLALREDYWLDEGSTTQRIAASWQQLYAPFSAEQVDDAAPFDPRDVYDLNPPLYFVLIRLLAGPQPAKFIVCLFSILPMVLGLALLTDWARRKLGARGALAVALVGASSPMLIYYGHEARPYALGFMLGGLLVWLGERLRGRPGPLLAASLAAAAAGNLTHFAFAWFTIAYWTVQGMAWLQARRDGDDPARRAAGAMMAGLAAGSFIAVLVILPQFSILHMCKVASSQVITPKVLMVTLGIPYCWVGSRPLPPWGGFALQCALVGVALLAVRRSPRRPQVLLGLTLWLLTMALPVIAYYWFGVAYYARYTIFAQAGWLMMLAGMAEETRWLAGGRKAAVAAVLLAMLGASAGWAAHNLGRPLRQQWRPIIETMRRQGRPGDAYGFAPYYMRVVFASNARTPLAMRFLDSRCLKPPPANDEIPPDIRRVWIVFGHGLNQDDYIPHDPARWRLERVMSTYQLDLYRLDRVTGQNPNSIDSTPEKRG